MTVFTGQCGAASPYTLALSGPFTMTYCVAIKLNAGLVFLSDSRTNAGLDQINTFRKMIVYEKPDDRFMVLLSAGNLSISQSVREILQVEQLKDHADSEPITIWNARSMFDAARVLGAAIRRVYERDAASLKQAGVDFNVTLIFGGQIKGEGMRLFQVYSAGNFIEATPETPYFQAGESKYGKPVLDRVITPGTHWTRPPSARWCPWTPRSNRICRSVCRWTWWSMKPTSSRPTRWCASTKTIPISECCAAVGGKSCARCLSALKTRCGTVNKPT